VTTPTIQYRVVRGKRDELVSGPDDAAVVITVGLVDAALDPTVAYMQGKLKAAGHTGVLLDALRSGEVATALAALAHQSA
jgi:hypothetical protein